MSTKKTTEGSACPGCLAQVQVGARFCSFCGAKVGVVDSCKTPSQLPRKNRQAARRNNEKATPLKPPKVQSANHRQRGRAATQPVSVFGKTPPGTVAKSEAPARRDVSGVAESMAEEDVIMLSADLERMLGLAVVVAEDVSSADNDDSDVKIVEPPKQGNATVVADEFTSGELLGLMEPSERKQAQGDFVIRDEVSSVREQRAGDRRPANLAQRDSASSLPTVSPRQKPAVSESFPPLSDSPTHHGQAFDTNELPMMAAQPPATAAFSAAPMPQPVFVQVPVPQPAMLPAEPSPTNDTAAVESTESRPLPETRLPTPPATLESAVTSPDEETKTESPVAKSDDDTGKGDSDSSGADSAAAKELAVARKKYRKQLERSVESARKDLLLLQGPLPDKLPRKISRLLAELDSVDAKSEEQLVRRIASTRSNAVVGPLGIHFVEAPENVRIAIAQSLSQIADASSSASLLNMLRGKSAGVVEAAVVEACIRSLVVLGRDECLLPLICSALVSPTNRSVLQAAMLEEDDSTQADFADRLKKFLNHKDDSIAVVALGLISNLHGESQLKLYSKLLGRESEVLRAAALEALGQSGENQAVRFLNPAMKDESAVVRAAAANSLALIHSPKSSVLLIEGLRDPEVRVRRNCAK